MPIALFLVQTVIFLGNGRRDKVGDAVGHLGKGLSDVMVRMFHK
ncbi:hypothetical protein BH18ACI4_BH18ACI4_29550 [soil metagenome]